MVVLEFYCPSSEHLGVLASQIQQFLTVFTIGVSLARFWRAFGILRGWGIEHPKLPPLLVHHSWQNPPPVLLSLTALMIATESPIFLYSGCLTIATYFVFCWPCILLQSLSLTTLTHNSFSYICLFQFSTCFEQPSAHHQESQLYQCDLWYMSLYVGDRVVCRFIWNSSNPAYHTVTYVQWHIPEVV